MFVFFYRTNFLFIFNVLFIGSRYPIIWPVDRTSNNQRNFCLFCVPMRIYFQYKLHCDRIATRITTESYDQRIGVAAGDDATATSIFVCSIRTFLFLVQTNLELRRNDLLRISRITDGPHRISFINNKKNRKRKNNKSKQYRKNFCMINSDSDLSVEDDDDTDDALSLSWLSLVSHSCVSAT